MRADEDDLVRLRRAGLRGVDVANGYAADSQAVHLPVDVVLLATECEAKKGQHSLDVQRSRFKVLRLKDVSFTDVASEGMDVLEQSVANLGLVVGQRRQGAGERFAGHFRFHAATSL
jgi:hypothetical protein